MRLKDKVAIVTGAGRGIGEAIALLFAEEGAKVVVNDVNEADGNRTGEAIKSKGGKAVVVIGSVTVRDIAQKMMDTAVKEFGIVDILVNNAGILRDAMLHKMTDEQWDQVIDVNLKGVFLCTQCAAQVMREKRYGKIINLSSAMWKGNPGQLNYSAAKAGVIGLTKTAAKELAPKGINVNAIAPGLIWTDMLKSTPPAILERMQKNLATTVPLNRLGLPRDVANVALFLASDESSYVTGQVIYCDGGLII
ncbi:MAG: 3-oxoacyl-ACP reductase FabG [Deltaproteobacteria bacterium]|nr:3-oxoacyl-ACP reductase FabG [Deltaproteobacteria bacterium]